jgi:hypothetical protein
VLGRRPHVCWYEVDSRSRSVLVCVGDVEAMFPALGLHDESLCNGLLLVWFRVLGRRVLHAAFVGPNFNLFAFAWVLVCVLDPV